MRMTWAAVLTALGLGCASVSHAAVTLYECQIEAPGAMGWVPELVIIAHNTEADTVTVSDPIGFAFNDREPIAGSVLTNNDKRISFRWQVEDISAGAGTFVQRMVYRATYLRANNRMVVTGRPLPYENNFRGQGGCRVTQR